ncbi:MAG TPA: alpha/beta hydrolase [Chloroflexota bacterium]
MRGIEDHSLPISATDKRLPGLIENLTFVPVEGGPHNIGWTHPEEVNKALLEFLGAPAPMGMAQREPAMSGRPG